MDRLEGVNERRCAKPDKQISMTDPDARSMATSGRGSGVVSYNVQTVVDTEHHLIIAHDVVQTGHDRDQLARMSKLAKATLDVDHLKVVADRSYFNSPEILSCKEADISVTLPKPQTSNNKKRNLFVKADFRYDTDNDVYICPAGEQLRRRMTTQELITDLVPRVVDLPLLIPCAAARRGCRPNCS